MSKIHFATLLSAILIFAADAIAQGGWTIKDGPTTIERVETSSIPGAVYILNFYTQRELVARSYVLDHGVGRSAGWYLEVPKEGVVVSFPYDFSGEDPPQFQVMQNGIAREIAVGTVARFGPHVMITKSGLIEIFGTFITPGGYLLTATSDPSARGDALWKVISPTDPSLSAQSSPTLRTRLEFALKHIATVDARKLPGISGIVTNENTTPSPVAPRTVVEECHEVPTCCCKPEELSADGKCRKNGIFVVGGWGKVGEIEAEIARKMENSPCMKNFTVRTYDNSVCPEVLAKEIATEMMAKKEACQGGPTQGDGYCYGGNILGLAMAHLGQTGTYEINTYTTSWDGTFRIYRVANWVAFGIVGAVMERPMADLMSNCVPKPGKVPSNVNFRTFGGALDHAFSDDSQAQGPAGSRHFLDPDTGHYSTIQKHFKYVSCCGDGRVNDALESCDPPGGECNWMHPSNSFVLPGVCDDQCQCQLTGVCGNGVVEEGEMCDPPGRIRAFCLNEVRCTATCQEELSGPGCPGDPTPTAVPTVFATAIPAEDF